MIKILHVGHQMVVKIEMSIFRANFYTCVINLLNLDHIIQSCPVSTAEKADYLQTIQLKSTYYSKFLIHMASG